MDIPDPTNPMTSHRHPICPAKADLQSKSADTQFGKMRFLISATSLPVLSTMNFRIQEVTEYLALFWKWRIREEIFLSKIARFLVKVQCPIEIIWFQKA
jgi:hypothetical protein